MKHLKKVFNRNFEFIVIAVVSLIIAIIIFCVGNEKNGTKEVAIAILVTGLSLSVGIKQLQIENDKMFKDLFTTFTQTYDEKFNDLLNDIERKFNYDNKYKVLEEERDILVDYLNFCAEEYLWYTKNRIDENVWQSWRNGMLYFLNITPINTFVLSENAQRDSYYGLFLEIGNDLKNWN